MTRRLYRGAHRGRRTRVARDYLIPREWLLRCAAHVRDDARSRLPVDPWKGMPLFAWDEVMVTA